MFFKIPAFYGVANVVNIFNETNHNSLIFKQINIDLIFTYYNIFFCVTFTKVLKRLIAYPLAPIGATTLSYSGREILKQNKKIVVERENAPVSLFGTKTLKSFAPNNFEQFEKIAAFYFYPFFPEWFRSKLAFEY